VNKALIALAIAGVLALGGARCVNGYKALDACTEFENRMPEAGHAISALESATEESVSQNIDRLAGELHVDVESANVSLEPLTAENAGEVSAPAAQAVQVAGKLRGHEIKGKVLTVDVRARAHRFLVTRRCDFQRKLLLAGQ
jgi:hypothetical protein